MRNAILKSLAILALFGSVLALVSAGEAQWRDRGYSRSDVARLLRQADISSNRFADMVEQALGTELVASTSDERFSLRARNLERQIDIVRQAFEDTSDFRGIRSEVSTMLDMARTVESRMGYENLDYATERQWMLVRSDLNQLAGIFDLDRVG